MLKTTSKNHGFFYWFFIDFWPILGSILEPIFLKNRFQAGGELKIPTFFSIFASCYHFEVPPGYDLVDFGSILASIL